MIQGAVLDNINSGSDFLLSMAVGGFSGLAGASTAFALSSISSAGFAGGFIAGSTSGFSAGFVGGAGTAWIDGASFAQGIEAGLISGGIAALSGGVIKGSISGYNSVKNGGAFWNGIGAEYSIGQGYVDNEIDLEQAKKFAVNYNHSSSTTDSEVLQILVEDEFRFYVGDYKNTNITTNTGGRGLRLNGSYINLKNREVSLGFIRQGKWLSSSIHISPKSLYAYPKDILLFRATVGHEIIHTYHLSQGLTHRPFTERIAYDYSLKTLANGSQGKYFFSLYKIPAEYRVTPPKTYELPFFIEALLY